MTTVEREDRCTRSAKCRRNWTVSASITVLGFVAVVAIVVAIGVARAWSPVEKTDAQIALASTVSIRGFGCGLVPRGGAGVVVGDGLILTDAHVVAGSTRLELTVGARITDGTVVHLDPNLDLALVQVNPRFGSTSNLIVGLGRARKGDAGTVAILRQDRLQSLRVPVLRAVSITTEDIYVKGQVTRSGYELQARTLPGDSGSALIVHGRVVAVLWSRSQITDARAWATDVAPIAAQIGAVAPRTVPSDTRCR
jgi:S1-C subfamily serine protease